ncbi:MAG: hypothetical protein DHS20C21_20120 [Gemmatimonadota bacterium]|nr:MAG: hypothetical protein DHS20C21_20120 [Gemmatimonadota bacterium]
MKLATSIAALLVFGISTAAFAAYPISTVDRVDLLDIAAQKDAKITGVHNPTPQAGGEDVGSAANIPALPYTDSGNTCSYLDDYDEVCPFSGSTAGDAVYQYTPGSNVSVDISLCNSGYDTKVFVYENAATPGLPYACNDDACGSDGFRSELVGVSMTAGNTYYIVVDGYLGACGDYELSVTENVPCIVDCPPGALAEGEVDCFEGYDDLYNAGCNATPNSFTNIPCDPAGGGVTVCGTYGGYFHPQSGFNYRDTDWYHLDPAANTGGTVWCVTGEYETLSGYLDASLGCGAPVFIDALVHGGCVTQCYNLPAGDLWLFVGTSAFGVDAGACGGAYTMTLDGYNCPPVSVEPATWGKVKSDFR